MRKMRLTANFMLAVLTAAAAMPLFFGLTKTTLVAAFLLVAASALFVEPAHQVQRRHSLQRGEIGAEEDDDGMSAAQKTVVAALKKHTGELSDAIAKSEYELKEHGKVMDETKNAITALGEKGEGLEARLDALEQKAVRGGGEPARIKTLGQLFIEHEGTKAFAAKEWHKGQSVALNLKDITSAAASAGDGIWSYREPEVISDPYAPRILRSLIPTVPVNSNLVEWVRTNVRTNNAAMVSETGTYPKSELTYDKVSSAIKKVGHYFKTSAEVLADFDRLQAEINTEGFEMLRQEEEAQLMAGDGTGENLTGLIPSATDYNVALTQSDDTALDVIRRGILQVRQSYYSATGIVMNPADWADIELLKDSQNRYIYGMGREAGPARLWGLPVVESDSMPAGQFMVGAFATAATIYDRMAASVFLSTEDGDNFTTDMVSVKFVERITLATKRQLSFVHGNLTGDS